MRKDEADEDRSIIVCGNVNLICCPVQLLSQKGHQLSPELDRNQPINAFISYTNKLPVHKLVSFGVLCGFNNLSTILCPSR